MAKLRIEGISKKFGDYVAVDGVDLEIEDAEFLVIVGPSGCGKTTLLRMIAGLEKPTSGEIYIGDRAVTRVQPKDRDVAMVFQDYALYAHMRVYDNLAFGLRMRNTDRNEIDTRVTEAARMMGIERLLDRRPRQLSGGERQRVALGRALVRRPVLFLMDEPLSNLDALLRVRMRTEIIKLHKEVMTTTVYVTHDQVEAMTMGSRIAVMNKGRLQQLGTPEEIYEQPANRFVAGFFGSPPMNFVPGELSHEDGALSYRSEDGLIQLALRDAKESSSSIATGPVLLGVRPEAIRLGNARPTASQPNGTGRVDVIEPLGYEVIIYITVGDRMLAVRREKATGLEEGESVPFFVESGELHLFDPETGEALTRVR